MKTAQVAAGKLVKASAKGALLGHSLASVPNPSSVDIVLTIGTRKYCLHYGGTVTFKPGKLWTAKDAPESPACP